MDIVCTCARVSVSPLRHGSFALIFPNWIMFTFYPPRFVYTANACGMPAMVAPFQTRHFAWRSFFSLIFWLFFGAPMHFLRIPFLNRSATRWAAFIEFDEQWHLIYNGRRTNNVKWIPFVGRPAYRNTVQDHWRNSILLSFYPLLCVPRFAFQLLA